MFALSIFLEGGGNATDAEDADEPPNKRHRCQQCQSRFFQQRSEITETHPHIMEWFDATATKEVKKEIIENCFKKDGRKWTLDLDKPFFKESKHRSGNIMEAYMEL